jgi:ABC-type sugar transport system permease subunit
MATISTARRTGFFSRRRGRILAENLTAYLFLLPATILIFLFGIFPVGFAFFVSLHNWRRFPGDYEALGNYEKALGSFAYVVFFWLAGRADLRRRDRPPPVAVQPPTANSARGCPLPALNAAAVVLYPLVFRCCCHHGIPQKPLGQDVTLQLFTNEFFASFGQGRGRNQWLLMRWRRR